MGKEELKCEECNEKFTYITELNNHRAKHNCEACKLVSKSSIKQKTQFQHIDNNLHKCLECTEHFYTIETLRRHIFTREIFEFFPEVKQQQCDEEEEPKKKQEKKPPVEKIEKKRAVKKTAKHESKRNKKLRVGKRKEKKEEMGKRKKRGGQLNKKRGEIKNDNLNNLLVMSINLKNQTSTIVKKEEEINLKEENDASEVNGGQSFRSQRINFENQNFEKDHSNDDDLFGITSDLF